MRDMEFKGFAGAEVKSAEKGLVKAVVARTNVVDFDGDLFLPGAFGEQVVAVSASEHASWGQRGGKLPIGKGVIREVGNEVIAEVQFFMDTQAGRETFTVVKEMGELQEWSYGFRPPEAKLVPPNEVQRSHGARRVYSKVKTREVSPVMVGATPATRTIAVKAAESLSDRIEAIHTALHKRNETHGTSWWAHEVFDDSVIVRAGATMLKIGYTIDGEGAVTLGEAVEVEVEYREVQKSADPPPPPTPPAPEPPKDAAKEALAQAAGTLEALKAQGVLK